MIEGVPIAELTPSALLGICVLLLLLGRIVPRSTLVDKAEECERWRLAYESERKARATLEEQTEELLEVARTSHSVLTAIFQNSSRIRQGGAADVAP